MSLGVILAMGFLLLVSLSITTALSALRAVIARQYTGFLVLTEALNILLSLGMSTCVVALIYQYVPARRVAWKAVFYGALVTALLFHAGRSAYILASPSSPRRLVPRRPSWRCCCGSITQRRYFSTAPNLPPA